MSRYRIAGRDKPSFEFGDEAVPAPSSSAPQKRQVPGFSVADSDKSICLRVADDLFRVAVPGNLAPGPIRYVAEMRQGGDAMPLFRVQHRLLARPAAVEKIPHMGG